MMRSAATSAGIKSAGLPDLAVLDAGSTVPCAAVFTESQAAAAPVLLSRSAVSSGTARGVVLNSGCANAGTGAVGFQNAQRMQESAAQLLGCDPTEILVCSTGPIGPQLPIDRVIAGIETMTVTDDGWADAAEAIRTTDTFAKTAEASDGVVSVWGMAKGAAMIRPNMATMLAVLSTNAAVGPSDLDLALRLAVGPSFNSLNIDGCQSTNDTVIAFATGSVAAELATVQGLLAEVCMQLAEMIARDGEETSRVVHLEVSGAASDEAARRLGLVMTDSDLVRSSFYGGDPNWGRLLQAAGVSGELIEPEAFGVSYEGIAVAKDGCQLNYEPGAIRARLTGDFTVEVTVGNGPGAATIISTDLTPGYVSFNGEPS